MKAKDMNGVDIKIGDKVNRWALIKRKTGEPKVRTVEDIAQLGKGGETMIWFKEGGGCHHPEACEVITE